MSSAATAAFLKSWRMANAPRTALVQIDLTIPSALTLRYATTELGTPDGSLWQAGATFDSIHETVSLLAPGLSPTSASFRLAKRKDASQTPGFSVQDLLYNYLFQNATVTIYLWVPDGTLAWSDALQVFRGSVSGTTGVDLSGVGFNLIQDLSWNKVIPPVVVDKVSYPNSPDVSQGVPIPIVYGDHVSPAMKAPWAAGYTNKSKQEDVGAGRGAVPLVLVDAGVGQAKVKLVGAGHLCASLLNRTNGHSLFIVGESELNPLDTGGITETDGVAESKLEIADENAIAYSGVIPIDVRVADNSATNPRLAMDVFNETSFATLDQNTGKNALNLLLPNMSALGHIEAVTVSLAFIGNASNAQNIRVDAYKPGVGVGGSGPAINAVATGTTPAVLTATWPAAYWDQTWSFGGNAQVWDVRVDFAGGTTNRASIIWVALVVKYRPNRSLVSPSSSIVVSRGGQMAYAGPEILGPGVSLAPGARIVEKAAAQYRLDGQFFGNVQGQPDNVSGDYTGVAFALIERPSDILKHLLVSWGGVTLGNIDASFTDARTTLRNGQPSDLKLACWIGERSNVQQVCQNVAAQGGMCVFLDRFTNKWLAFPWKTGAQVEYDRPITYEDVLSITAEETSVVDVKSSVRVRYGFDHFKGKTQYEAFVNPLGSSQGFTEPLTRDQLLQVVTSVNQKLDFVYSSTTFAATLTVGTYASGMDLAVETQLRMRTLAGGTSIAVGYSFTIKTGFNDVFAWTNQTGPTNYSVTLSPGDYTPEGLAIECARAMNTVAPVGVAYGCTYSHATNLFTWTVTGDQFEINGTSTLGSGTGTSANRAMGSYRVFPTAGGFAASVAAELTRYKDRFHFSVNGGDIITLKWLTGVNVAVNCADLLGFIETDAVNVVSDIADYSRGARETTATTYQSYYGPREENTVTADFIRDETTAVELRNRIFDLTAKPRVIVRFTTFKMPDARRMMTFTFDTSLNGRVVYPMYGSGGSWSGKTMRILEVEQKGGPDFHQEILAISAD